MPSRKQGKILAKGLPPGKRKAAEKTTLEGMPSKERSRHKTVSVTSTPIPKTASTTAKRITAIPRSRSVKNKMVRVEKLTPEQIKEREEADREWERILATPESDMVIAMMAIEIEEEIANGTVTEGGWDEV